MKKKRILIIGGVAAGMKTAARLRRLDAEVEIVVIERSRRFSYGACALPYFVEGLFSDLDEVRQTPAGAVRNELFFAGVKGFEVLSGCAALEIDRRRQRVLVRCLESDTEEYLGYDHLVLATGCRPLMPPVPGIELEGVFPLKTMDDAENIERFVASAKNAVIVGAGLIGLEMAAALRVRGLKVSLLEMQDQVLGGVVDPDLAGLAARELTGQGVQLRLKEGLVRLEGEAGRVRCAVTAQGRYPADLVIMAVGVRPETELAAAAGIKLGSTGGILVDRQMRTSDPLIYAAGDCVESTQLQIGQQIHLPLGSTANRQGRVVADQLGGAGDQFPGVLGTLIVKLFDQTFARTGLSFVAAQKSGFEPESMLISAPDRVHSLPGAKPVIIRLVADRNTRKLLGAQMAGPGEIGGRINVLVSLLSLNATVDDLAHLDLAYAPPFATAMDPLHHAANALRNKLDGLAFSCSSLEVQLKRVSGEPLLLDVRSPAEAEQVRIPGAILIPLGQLRERLHELPRGREIIPFCKLSLRGYEAARILMAAGYKNVHYLEGGILAWPFDLETGALRKVA
jgi:NADPH-dependent 2,4-dienoyl-CoA reductase/sulfur reductase-like enzyme/rhodanese-related sulfurtransferase